MTNPAEQKIYPADMGTQCAFCAGKSFRRSRLQAKDLFALLLLHYPVRCLSCSKRQAVSLLVARRALPSTVKQVRVPDKEAPWSGWNSSEAGAAMNTPSIVGGSGFSALPVHAPMAMPDLKGITLKHVSSPPVSDDTARR